MENEIHPLLSQSASPSPTTPTRTRNPATSGASFTALLGLPPSRAVELLHEPTFPSDPVLVDRATRCSVFATASGGLSSAPSPEVSPPPPPEVTKKRKDSGSTNGNGNSKAKVKKGKHSEEDKDTDGENKLPYVHVRARRGQATDSHSLAERARREKINERMKLLQELVPGCSKISGTAMVLDEIINHVQYLQRQVKYLSMRLAAVNPRIDFSGLDSFISSTTMECGRLTIGNAKVGELDQQQQPVWSKVGVSDADQMNNISSSKTPQSQLPQNQLQQCWHANLLNAQNHLQPSIWARDGVAGSMAPQLLRDEQHSFVGPGPVPHLAFDCINQVEAPIQSNQQLKMEL